MSQRVVVDRLVSPRVTTAVVVAFSVLLTILSFWIAWQLNQSREAAAIRSRATLLASSVEEYLRDYETLVEHLTGLFAVTNNLSRTDMETYLDRLDIESAYPDLKRLSFAVPSPAPVSDALPRLIVKQIEPRSAATESRLGKELLPAIDETESLEQLIIGGRRISLLTVGPDAESDARFGRINLLSAVYKGPGLPETAEDRRELLIGVTTGTVDLPSLLRRVLASTESDNAQISIQRSDLNVELATQSGRTFSGGDQVSLPLQTKSAIGALSATIALPTADPGIFSIENVILAGGSFFTVLLGLLTWLITSRREAAINQLSEVEEQNKIRLVLLRELNHRVKNVMATVVSLASLSRRHADTIDDFYQDFSGRVTALSSAHNVLIQGEWHGARLTDLIQAEARAFETENGSRIELEGEDVDLRPSASLTLGLAFHELATNAAKYGALSNEFGRVKISWAFVENGGKEGRLVIRWRESGGPLLSGPPQRQGFGSVLLKKLTARELSGEVNIRYPTDGLECDIEMAWAKVRPLKDTPDFEVRTPLRQKNGQA